MSMFSKLTGLAQKALDKSGSSTPGGSSGQTDWRAIVRTAADTLTGDGRNSDQVRQPEPQYRRSAAPPAQAGAASPSAPLSSADRAAIARYDYLLQTADPHQVELVHREAFERLTPAQREQIQQRMTAELPAHEHPRTSTADDLARTAARTEASRPGVLKGLLARAGGGAGRGVGRGALIGGAAAGAGFAAGGVLTAVAGGAILSSVAGPLLEQAANIGVDFESLANGIDLESIAGGVNLDGLTGGVDELATSAGDTVSGLGDQVSEFGSGFTLPGLDDLFGR
ncbi:hypothetical protein IWX81_002611 [Salinibacterium sp. CAN_S4]|uniref:hypothetical protein n=1 Tax=Salinibacterium sp. CAN_S4 TaxID=2787727 RepID=UPI0018EF418B